MAGSLVRTIVAAYHQPGNRPGARDHGAMASSTTSAGLAVVFGQHVATFPPCTCRQCPGPASPGAVGDSALPTARPRPETRPWIVGGPRPPSCRCNCILRALLHRNGNRGQRHAGPVTSFPLPLAQYGPRPAAGCSGWSAPSLGPRLPGLRSRPSGQPARHGPSTPGPRKAEQAAPAIPFTTGPRGRWHLAAPPAPWCTGCSGHPRMVRSRRTVASSSRQPLTHARSRHARRRNLGAGSGRVRLGGTPGVVLGSRRPVHDPDGRAGPSGPP